MSAAAGRSCAGGWLVALILTCWPGASFPAWAGPSSQETRLQDPLTEFVLALASLRQGEDAGARDALMDAALRVERELRRTDAQRIARYYLDLVPEAHAPSLELEARLDEMRARVAESDAKGPAATTFDFMSALRALESESRGLLDVVPRAHVLSLLTRLEVRSLEASHQPNVDALERADDLTRECLSLFGRAGMETPRLEPLWTRARIELLRGDLRAAMDSFQELERVAKLRPSWRERALVGQIGVHRAVGSPHGAERVLARLARSHDPSTCWSLAREVAVQRIGRDDAEGVLQWLEDHAPSVEDTEIDWETAQAEWDALWLAAELRLRRVETKEIESAPPLLRAALELQLGAPWTALDLLGSYSPGPEQQIEHACLTGRALRAIGRPEQALVPLNRAFELAVERGQRTATASASRVTAGSAIGEWLGLSYTIDLALCHVTIGDPVSAAAVLEASHAAISVEAARERVLRTAAQLDLGLITWMSGADRTLRVHVDKAGKATAQLLPHGRSAMERAVDRARRAVRDGDNGAPELEPFARAILPEDILSGKEAGSVLLLPHGPLERAPFEALPRAHGVPLGLDLALRVASSLPAEDERAARIDLRRARWIGFGAPTNTDAPLLEHARRELQGLDRLSTRFDAHVGPEFTAAALARALSQTEPLHIATHQLQTAHVESIAPLALLTSNGELLDARKLSAIGPRLPLLVLLACGSADGAALDGLSVRGLAQLAIESGTREALVTQWPIDDRAASRASLAFHGALRAGAEPAEAARRARSLLSGLRYKPQEWSAYRLLGAP